MIPILKYRIRGIRESARKLTPARSALAVLALLLILGCRKADPAPPQNGTGPATPVSTSNAPALGAGAADAGAASTAAVPNRPPTAATGNGLAFSIPDDTDPNELADLHQAGDDLIQRRRFEEAIGLFQKVLQKKTDDEEAHFNLGFCFARLTQMDQAVHHYSEAIRILPEYAEAHNNLGNLLARQGHIDKALEHFKAAIHNAPENASAHNNLGTTLVRLGKMKEAIPSFEEAARLNPNYVEAYYNLGSAYQNQGRTQDAIKQYQRALQIDPSFQYAQTALKKLWNQPKPAP